MIKFDSVNRYYGDIPAVEDVSFEIGSGEIVGLLGHNGAGKTTIMKMMTGFLEPTSGSIEIDGMSQETDSAAIKRKIGYLPENCPVYNDMLVFEYLCYAGTLHGVPSSQVEERVIDAMKLTEIVPKADYQLSALSRGYRQRVGVAQAILQKSDILVLDEPTNGLDPTQILQMRTLIKDLAKESTILISTHILQEVQAVCDRVIIIQNGKKALDARLSELQSTNSIVVDTDMKEIEAVPLLEKIEDVSSVEIRGSSSAIADSDAITRYVVKVSDESAMQRCSAEVASRITGKGRSLFALFPEMRDLETIFGEITS